jgi:hypothetical protein
MQWLCIVHCNGGVSAFLAICGTALLPERWAGEIGTCAQHPQMGQYSPWHGQWIFGGSKTHAQTQGCGLSIIIAKNKSGCIVNFIFSINVTMHCCKNVI